MPPEESKTESFEESVSSIAEKIRTERESEDTPEQESDTEEMKKLELEKIRSELQESYAESGGGASDDDDDDDDDEEEVDSTSGLEPANLEEEQGTGNYLEHIPEEYREPVTGLVQEAVEGGIVRAVAKAQKKNDPYLVDIFHDSLAQLLHQRMQDQGLL